MKRIVLIILLLLLNLVLKAQVTEEQTWEVYQPGVKLIYEINGCQNNTPEPTGEDYFFCDGPDRVVVKSFGLTHATVYDTTVFEYNNEKYICFSTEVGLSIYNETAKKWRNLPYQVFDDVSSATTLIVYSSMYAGNGKIFFNAKNKGFYTFDLSNSSLNKETFSNISVADEMKKNENTGAFFNSIWSVEEGRSINKFQNNIVTRIPIPNLNPSTLGGFDIGTDDKLYIALKDKGILVFNPNDNSYELITPENSELISAEIKDVDFDDNGNLWIVYGNFKENAGLIKWNAANNTFENFVTPDKNDANPITFDTVEILNNEVWASASKSFFQADEDDFGIFKLSIENGDPVWKHFDQQFFKEKGFSEKLSLNNIREQDGILYLSTQNDGSIKYDGKKWSHYSALRNNIPSGYTKDIKMIAQNKRGGFSFTS